MGIRAVVRLFRYENTMLDELVICNDVNQLGMNDISLLQRAYTIFAEEQKVRYRDVYTVIYNARHIITANTSLRPVSKDRLDRITDGTPNIMCMGLRQACCIARIPDTPKDMQQERG